MRRFGRVMLIAGFAAMVVGLLGLLSLLLKQVGVAFEFAVAPWYGPFLGGAVFVAVGWVLRRQPQTRGR